MLEWLNSQSGAFNVAINLAMLLVWLSYLQLLLASYRNQKRPKILVNRGGGTGWDSRCLITNMSEKAVYVYAAIIKVRGGGQHWQSVITERRGIGEASSAAQSRERIGQGPLGPGEMLDLGSIRELIDLALIAQGEQERKADPNKIDRLEIKIAAIYDSEDIIIGARREFEVLSDGRLKPAGIYTQQIRSRRQRKVLADDVLEQLSA